MKYIALILIMFTSNISNSQSINFFMNIAGNPKEYKEIHYEAKKIKNEYVKGKYLYDESYVKNSDNEFIKQRLIPSKKWELPQNKYNIYKQITESINYNETGEIINKTIFKYNSQNKLAEEQFYYDSDTLISDCIYEYRNNLLVKKIEKEYFHDEENSYQLNNTTFTYDVNNNLISELNLSDFQEVQYSYKYDKLNYLIEVYRKNSLYDDFKELRIVNKIKYINLDQYNWTEIFFEEIKTDHTKSKVYFIERIYKY